MNNSGKFKEISPTSFYCIILLKAAMEEKYENNLRHSGDRKEEKKNMAIAKLFVTQKRNK